MKTHLEAALAYLDHGIGVVPLVPGEKNPIIKSWREYQKRLPTRAEVEGWWKKHPRANVGLVTGRVSNLLVVDLDKYKPDYSEDIANEYFPDSLVTPTATSPRGGQHLYFTFPDADLTVGVATLPGIDFRGEGGYIVAPPSVNGNGNAYAWVEGLSIFDIKRQAPPLAYINKLLLYVRGVIGGIVGSENASGPQAATAATNGHKILIEGRRDSDLFHLANCLVKGGCEQEYLTQALEILAKNCTPPFSEKEARTKIESAIQRSDRRERSWAEEVREFVAATSGHFSATDGHRELQAATRNDRRAINVALQRMCQDGLIERYSDKNGVYRKVETKVDEVNFLAVASDDFKIKMPLGLNDLVSIYDKNIIMIAGSKSAGKTTFMLNLVLQNMHSHDVVYMNSEMGDIEFRRRLEKFGGDLSAWKFKAYHRSHNFADLVGPEKKIYIIDYLEIHDNFYEVAKPIREIHEKLKDGIAIIAIQKNQASKVGRGGDFSMEKSRLYLTMDYVDEQQATCVRIVDAKEPKIESGARGLFRYVKIIGGHRLSPMGEWRR
ncbi:MAG: bifunctional DNA primase/polymerase [Dehalococcoidia bacterium]|jgi:hypothetical protein